MISVENCVEAEVHSLREHVTNSIKGLLKTFSDEEMLEEGREKVEIQKERMRKYKEKLYGKFYNSTTEGRN